MYIYFTIPMFSVFLLFCFMFLYFYILFPVFVFLYFVSCFCIFIYFVSCFCIFIYIYFFSFCVFIILFSINQELRFPVQLSHEGDGLKHREVHCPQPLLSLSGVQGPSPDLCTLRIALSTPCQRRNLRSGRVGFFRKHTGPLIPRAPELPA